MRDEGDGGEVSAGIEDFFFGDFGDEEGVGGEAEGAIVNDCGDAADDAFFQEALDDFEGVLGVQAVGGEGFEGAGYGF